jgi:heat shock protein HtpX
MIFLLVIIGLGFAFSQAYGAPEILFFAVIFSSVSALISYFFSDKIVLSMSGAKPIDLHDNPELFRLVENLAITAGLPMPRIYIIEDSALNAFATGRNPQNAVIAVTTGLLQKLNKTELEGVLAHELSHIGNYDIRFMTLVVILVGIITLLADWMLRMSLFGGNKKNSSEGGNNGIFLLIGLGLAILSPIIGMLIKLAISRQREYLADATGVLLTRYPEGLASALEKIAQDHEPLETANKATAHLYISNPLRDHEGDGQSWFAELFNTHPPIEERIKRLRQMDNQL